MPSKSVINNVSILQKLTRGAKEDVKGRVDKVVEFYRDRKISQYEIAKKNHQQPDERQQENRNFR